MRQIAAFTLALLAVSLLAACLAPPASAPGPQATGAPTSEPAAEADAPPAASTLDPTRITIDPEGLAASWQAVAVPATPYDASMPPGPMGLPAHVEILFDGADPASVQPGGPVIYIIPVDAYRQLWDEAGNPAVTETIARIEQFAAALNTSPTAGVPVLPFEQVAGANDLAVQISRVTPAGEVNLTSATQDGYRFVGRWAQDANPVTNQGLHYVYQGFTNDGVYLVSAWWPVSTSALPNDVSELPADQMQQFDADPQAHIANAAEMLNGLASDAWTPDLASLDALVASLQIQDMTPAGLLDITWEWVSGPAQPGSSDMVTVEEPSQYQATYGADGVLTFTADCNNGSAGFTLNDSGNNGGMLVDPTAAVTLAECGPDSLAPGFVNSLRAAQSYRVQAGGSHIELVLPAGGGELLLRAALAASSSSSVTSASADQACITGQIIFAGDAPLPAGATAQVQLQDTSRADAAATVLGEQIIADPGQFPIAYEVCYDPGAIEENRSYSMAARITASDGALLYINDTNIPVIASGSPSADVEIPVIRVGG